MGLGRALLLCIEVLAIFLGILRPDTGRRWDLRRFCIHDKRNGRLSQETLEGALGLTKILSPEQTTSNGRSESVVKRFGRCAGVGGMAGPSAALRMTNLGWVEESQYGGFSTALCSGRNDKRWGG